MTQRYLGGIITANPTEPSSNLSTASASGMWTLQEAFSFYKAGDWPDPTNPPTVGLFMGGTREGLSGGANYLDIVDKINGFLVPKYDYLETSKAMKKLVDENLRSQMGIESRSLCESKFNVSDVNNMLLKEMGLL